MKTFKQFRIEQEEALLKLQEDSKGFKSKEKKRKKQEYLSSRERKIRKLRRLDTHWKGLEL